MADLTNLLSNMGSGITWLFGMFTRFIAEISSNDLLLYPVLLFLVMGSVTLVIKIVKKFGMKSRRS